MMTTTTIDARPPRGLAALVLTLVLLAGAGAQAELEAGAAWLDGSAAGAGSLALGAEGLAGPAAARASLRLQGLAGPELSGSAETRSEVSLSGGAFTGLLSLEGGVSAGSAASPSWRGGGGLVLILDGLAVSAKAMAALERRSDEGVLAWTGRGGLELSLAAGEAILKPRCEASLSLPDAGGLGWTLLPGLGLSWYPGLPLSAFLAGGWRRDIADGGTQDRVLGQAGLDAALGPLLLSLEASGSFTADGLSEGELALALKPDLGRLGGARAALPLRLSWVQDGSPLLSLFAGLSLGFD